MSSRQTVFISHGNPEDNEIAGWLAARLAAAGYKVWIDLWHDKGHPTWEEIESEIRINARRVIAIVSRLGAAKPGFKDEINAALGVARDLDDLGFIIPVRLDDISFRTEVPIQLGRLNFVDGHLRGWDEILADLLTQFEKDGVAKADVPANALFETWLARRRAAAELVSSDSERVLTNWFQVEAFPDKVNFFTSDSLRAAWDAAATNLKFPNRYHDGILCTFAPADEVRIALPLGVRLKRISEVDTESFLAGNEAAPLFAAQLDAKRAVVDLIRQGFSLLGGERGFQPHELSNRLCWCPKASTVGEGQISFNADGVEGKRKLLGRYKEFFWHYGVSIDVAWTPPVRITASGHVLFSADGEKIISDASTVVKLRRRALISKRNAWWRDVMLAYFSRVADGAPTFALPMGGAARLTVRSAPLFFTSPLKLRFDSDFDDPSDDPLLEVEEALDEDELIEGDDAEEENQANTEE